MEAAQKIRAAVSRVSLLRKEEDRRPLLANAVAEIKRLQARRFAGTYADLLAAGPYADAARFFLEELYSDKDYSQRDAQFARIAGAIEKLFPEQVAATAVSLAELHALTEEFDQAIARAWIDGADRGTSDAGRYVAAWREVGRRSDREGQLSTVLVIGEEMARLTRAPGLRLMLKMMRGPAVAAGLGSLQRFLETGFDTFAAMAGRRDGAAQFLGTIRGRESALIAALFDDPFVACETQLAATLGQAP
jgi:hypothetical protein